MSESIVYPKPSGATYTIPDVGDFGWGQAVTNFLVAVPNGTVPTSGTFTLTGDVNFGAAFGLLSKYFTTLTSNPATAGVFRLANTESVGWRNAANSGNNLLAVNGSDQLTYNGSVLASGGTISSIVGTANQVIVTNGTGPTTTLSTPQDIGTTSNPSFNSLTASGGGLTLGNGANVGNVFLTTGNSNSIQITAPTTAPSSYNIVLPTTQGTAGQALKVGSVSGSILNLVWG